MADRQGPTLQPSNGAKRQARESQGVRAPQGLHAMRRKAYDSVLASLGSHQHEILDEEEMKFLQAVEFGDLPTTRTMLERPDTVARLLKCTDYKDRTCLEIATENEHFDIVEHLIRVSGRQLSIQAIHESLMVAISKGYLRITQTLLTHPMFQKSKDKFRLGSLTNYFQPKNNSKFDQDISPIMLAAHCNEIDIIRLLLRRGDTIKKPHHTLCECTSCYNKRLFDPLKHSIAGIHAYRALASPAYISLTSQDPILTAFLLSNELMQLSRIEKEFQNVYKDLAKQCKTYASDLLEMCQNSQEVRTILNQRGNFMDGFAPADSEEQIDGDMGLETETNSTELARLRLAIKYYQKQFVAHPHCQHQLATMWYDGFPGWRQSGFLYKVLFILLIPLCLPFLAVIYLVAPNAKWSRLVSTPLVKFITHTASYLVFLTFIFLESTLVETYESQGNIYNADRFRNSTNDAMYSDPTGACSKIFNFTSIANGTFPVRFSAFTIFEWFIVLFIAGTLWGEIKQMYEEGYQRYLASVWNWLDIAMLNFYMTCFTLKLCSYRKSSFAIDFFVNTENACDMVLRGDPDAIQMYYYVMGDRHFWNDDDPILLAEALFAIANVLSFSRMSYVLPLSEFLGPLQISLGRMLGDIVRFGVVFGVVFMAFFCSLYNLYWSYGADNGVNKVDGCDIEASQFGFGTFQATFLTLFWALFGLAQPENPNIPNSTEYGDGHQLTSFVGTMLFIVYFIVMGLVMLNMLIAMMSNSFQEIESDQDVEWKFARSQLWLSYFEKGATLPIPFNLIPSPKSFYYVYKWFRRQIIHFKERKQNGGSMRPSVPMKERRNGVFNIMNHSELTRTASAHESTMKGVVKRYLFKLQREKENDEVNEGELDEIKNDISSLRFELMEQLRKDPKSPTVTSPPPTQLSDVHLQDDAVKSMSFHIACVENRVENMIEQMETLRHDLLLALNGRRPPASPSRVQYI